MKINQSDFADASTSPHFLAAVMRAATLACLLALAACALAQYTIDPSATGRTFTGEALSCSLVASSRNRHWRDLGRRRNLAPARVVP